MDTSEQTTFDATPKQALAAILEHAGPLLVDLDETLYLRNSTEDFLDTARPSALAFLLLKLIELLGPWRWTGLATRDAWRVRVICLLMPWTIVLWRRRAIGMAKQWANEPLLQALRDGSVANRASSTAIVTLGFGFIVNPLIAGFGLMNTPVIAMSPWRLRERRAGKLVRVTKMMGEDAVRRSLVITDALDDQDILARCALPLRVIWPSARFVDAFRETYVPGQYLAKIKRPGQQYIYRMILREDYLFWILASISLAPNFATHIVGLGLLLFSFWTIYEWGYADNDVMAARHESDPHLSNEYHSTQVNFSTPLAWLWAAVSGVSALFVLRWPALPSVADFVTWAGILAALFSCYWIYNRIDKVSRIWLYAALRFLRIGAFMAIVPVSVIGVAAVGAYVVSRWIPYVNYRSTNAVWAEERIHTTWLVFYCMGCVIISTALGLHALWSPAALALLIWNIYKARFELADIARSVHRIDGARERFALNAGSKSFVNKIHVWRAGVDWMRSLKAVTILCSVYSLDMAL